MLSYSWVFFVERVCFRFNHKNKVYEIEQFGLQNTKTYGGKIYSRRHIFRAKVYKSNIQAKRWHSKYEMLKKHWKMQLLVKLYAYQAVYSYRITDL